MSLASALPKLALVAVLGACAPA